MTRCRDRLRERSQNVAGCEQHVPECQEQPTRSDDGPTGDASAHAEQYAEQYAEQLAAATAATATALFAGANSEDPRREQPADPDAGRVPEQGQAPGHLSPHLAAAPESGAHVSCDRQLEQHRLVSASTERLQSAADVERHSPSTAAPERPTATAATTTAKRPAIAAELDASAVADAPDERRAATVTSQFEQQPTEPTPTTAIAPITTQSESNAPERPTATTTEPVLIADVQSAGGRTAASATAADQRAAAAADTGQSVAIGQLDSTVQSAAGAEPAIAKSLTIYHTEPAGECRPAGEQLATASTDELSAHERGAQSATEHIAIAGTV